MHGAGWVPHWHRVKLNSCWLSCFPLFGRYHELQDTGNWVGGGGGGGQLGMGTVSVYIWQPILSKYGCTYFQSMPPHTIKICLPIFPKYGCPYYQSMPPHTSKVWLPILSKYASPYFQSMDARIIKVCLPILPKYGCPYYQNMPPHISKVWLPILSKYASPYFQSMAAHIIKGRELGGGVNLDLSLSPPQLEPLAEKPCPWPPVGGHWEGTMALLHARLRPAQNTTQQVSTNRHIYHKC